ncbi:MAG: hypothetical protein ACEQSA_00280 [Weeksellaceae bacterium]
MTTERDKSLDHDPRNNSIHPTAQFFSDITGLPVQTSSVFPELDSAQPDSNRIPYTFAIQIGTDDEQYAIQGHITFGKEDYRSEWLPETHWELHYNGDLLLQKGWSLMRPYTRGQLSNTAFVQTELAESFERTIGGVSTDVAFMDYEDFTLESLQGKNNYFASPYLGLMTHMKQRGLQMPPILGKQPQLAEAMKQGDVETVTRILNMIQFTDFSSYDPRCQSHMTYEADQILHNARNIQLERNPFVPLEQSFPDLEVITIPGEASGNPACNVLLVENDLNNYGFFTDVVTEVMTRDGNLAGTKLIREYNLPACRTLCVTGKIHIIIFDWSNPSDEEVLRIGNTSGNHSQTAAVMTADGIKYLVQGKLVDASGLQEEATKHDMRSRWMTYIAAGCEKAGVRVPPYTIIRNPHDISFIPAFVAQINGQTQ